MSIRAHHPPADVVFDSGGLRLHALDWRGPAGGAGRDVLLLHGLASSAHWWDLVAPHLVAAGLAVVALDQRGHGESDKPGTGYGFDEVVADALGAIHHFELAEPVVVGHSWGATASIRLLSEHPDAVAAVVAVDGGFGGLSAAMTKEKALELLRPPPLPGERADLIAMIRSGDLAEVWSEEVERIVLTLFEDAGEDGYRRRLPLDAHMEIVEAIYESDPPTWLDGLRRPALLLAARGRGDERLLARKQELAESITNPLVRVDWLEDSFHDVPLQRPAEVAARIVGFVSSL